KAYSIKGTKVDCDFDANGWRLPTEAEWAQAAKSGSNLSWTPQVNLLDEKTSIYSGSHIVDDVAWYGDREFDVSSKTWKATGKGNCERAMPVGLKKAVRPGIYDLSGNVGEWCWDNYKASWFKELKDKNLVHVINPQGPSEESEKVIRGGSFERGPRGNRITYRRRGKKSLKRPDIGVRFVRTLDKQVKK
ncbi:MAG: SUMF1/EgtB/PvdO family nonheme iron enzyme, partial [Myxococcota bacterium]|nr:SUMF1/EgtB/PvdO family nonheme iron enzyme [Myxococcota bacterium]